MPFCISKARKEKKKKHFFGNSFCLFSQIEQMQLEKQERAKGQADPPLLRAQGVPPANSCTLGSVQEKGPLADPLKCRGTSPPMHGCTVATTHKPGLSRTQAVSQHSNSSQTVFAQGEAKYSPASDTVQHGVCVSLYTAGGVFLYVLG